MDAEKLLWAGRPVEHARAGPGDLKVKHFLITGYPRSGTAWLANLFTWGPALCVHDPLEIKARGEGDPLAPGFAPEGVQHLGFADSALATYLEHLTFVEDIPLAIVWRSRAEAERSFRAFASRLGLSNRQARAGFGLCAAALEALARARPYHTLHFAELGDRAAIGRLWERLLPGVPFPAARFDLLKRMRITTDLERRGLWAG